MLTDLCRSQLNDRNNDFPFHQSSTESEDCNVAMTSEAVELVTGAQLTAQAVRKLARDPSGPTGTVLARRTYASQGMQQGVDWQVLSRMATDGVRALLDAGWFVVLFVDYGKLQDTAPEIVGDRNFRGIHAIALADRWRGKQGNMTHYYDPLADGRTRGKWTAPKGVQSVKFSIVRDAGYGYTGTSSLSGHAVRP
jgi:hypothetical protein